MLAVESYDSSHIKRYADFGGSILKIETFNVSINNLIVQSLYQLIRLHI